MINLQLGHVLSDSCNQNLRDSSTATKTTCGRAASLLLVILVFLLAPCSSRAINIVMDFDEAQSDSPTFDPTGSELVRIMRAVESYWQEVIEDPWTLNISYYWDDLNDTNGTLGLHTNQGTSGGKPTDALIRFDTQRFGVERDWYFDDSPANFSIFNSYHSEFDLQSTLFHDLTGTQPTDWYNGAPPDMLEVGYVGIATSTAAMNRYDLFSVALHEVGHALGMTTNVAATEIVDLDYDFDSSSLRGANAAVRSLFTDPYHLAARGTLMFPNSNIGERVLPSATDVLAIAAASNWTEIDLFRKDFITAATNNTWVAANWVGGRVPDNLDDAFIRSTDFRRTVELVGPAEAHSLFLGEGNSLSTNAYTLNIVDTVKIDRFNTQLFVDSGGRLNTVNIIVQNNGALFARGGVIDAVALTVGTSSTVAGGYTGGIDGVIGLAYGLTNDGKILAQGGEFFIGGTGTHWDLDGTGENGLLDAASGDLLLQLPSPLSDDFSGWLRVREGNTLASSQPFVFDADARIQLEGGTTSGNEAKLNVIATLTSSDARLEVSGIGRALAPLTLAAGTIYVADGGRLHLDGNATFRGGSINTTGSGNVWINGATEFPGGTIQLDGLAHQNGDATVSGPTIINGSGTWDMDGDDGSPAVWHVNNDLTLNVNRIENIADHRFHGQFVLSNNGTSLTINTSSPWTLVDRLTLQDATTLAGSATMLVDGTISSEDGTISAPIVFHGSSEVAIGFGHEGYQLELDGRTTYQGGKYHGGTIQQDGIADVIASTTLGENNFKVVIPGGNPPYQRNWLQLFDWDGSVGTTDETNILPGTTFTINAVSIESNYATDGYDGTVNINGGTLIVNTGARIEAPPPNLPVGTVYPAIVTPLPWRLDGTMNLREQSGSPAFVTSAYASPMWIYGDVHALAGNAVITMPVTLFSSANVHVANGAALSMNLYGGASGSIDVDSGGLYRLTGTSTLNSSVSMTIDGTTEFDANVTVQGGTFSGAGTLRMLDNTDFDETTQLNVYSEFSAGGTNTIAAGKELQLGNGAVVENGAIFQGDGALRNLFGSDLSLIQSATTLGVELINEGTFSPRSSSTATGVVNLEGFTQLPTGSFKMEIAGSSIDLFDRIDFNNSTPQLGGLLDINLVGFTPALSAEFRFLFADGFSGTFSNIGLDSRVQTADGSGSFLYSCTSTVCKLSDFVSLGLTGDYNNDGMVDAADYALFRHFEGTTHVLANDPLGGTIGQAQYDQWRAHFGQTAGSGALTDLRVPEPATCLLAMIGLVVLSWQQARTARRRARSQDVFSKKRGRGNPIPCATSRRPAPLVRIVSLHSHP